MNRFRPGRLSRELRNALDLGRHDIPIHIYRMRTLGYPPGWLKKAVVGGNLTIFDSVNLESCPSEISYNKSSLIGYPGFNVELDHSARDDYMYLKCPPMQKHHMLDNFYASLSCGATEKNSVAPKNSNYSSWSRQEITETVVTLSDSESGETNSDSSLNGETQNESQESHPTADISIVHEHEQGTPTSLQPVVIGNGSLSENTDQSSFSMENPSKRPSLEAFSIGIQPFRPFENLQGVNGGYLRVLKALKNSRKTSNACSNGSLNLSGADSQSPSIRQDRNIDNHSSHKARR
ncbi:unnamed protein product [Heterobilharzia americana]|nr:unnamed protein product [Heterobilharzia americana]CAH8516890.1 unnamed protein product [Heterobilharzia americana]